MKKLFAVMIVAALALGFSAVSEKPDEDEYKPGTNKSSK